MPAAAASSRRSERAMGWTRRRCAAACGERSLRERPPEWLPMQWICSLARDAPGEDGCEAPFASIEAEMENDSQPEWTANASVVIRAAPAAQEPEWPLSVAYRMAEVFEFTKHFGFREVAVP